MKGWGRLLLVVVAVSILTYGMSSSVDADNHDIAPVSISTDQASYATGEQILLSGFVKDYDGSVDVTLMVFDPSNNIVTVAQITPNADGNFSLNMVASGMIKKVGEYAVKVTWGPQTNQTIFDYFQTET